jgi:hypothetical protein
MIVEDAAGSNTVFNPNSFLSLATDCDTSGFLCLSEKLVNRLDNEELELELAQLFLELGCFCEKNEAG